MAKRDLLDVSLLALSSADAYTVRDAAQNVIIIGGIGSGKTTGSGAALATAYLVAKMGGIVLCAKPEEAELWRRYCAATGRTASLIEWDGSVHGYNFLSAELARQGGDGINSVVELMMRVLEIARNASPMPGRAGEAFWDDSMRQMLRNSLAVLLAATGTVRIADILEFVRSAPTNPEQMNDPKWQAGSFFCHCFVTAAERLAAGPVPGFDAQAGKRATAYWGKDFAALDAKTRGNILISLTTSLDRFNHGWLQRAFCGETTIAPELCFHGAIIVLNMPALTRNEDGIIAQQLFKYMFQRAVLARNGMAPAQRERPVFLWADECQYFLNSFDAEWLSTSRGSRGCTVFLSQSLPTFYAKMGGEQAHDRVHHLLSNFATKIWHSNSCSHTNQWAADTIGKAVQQFGNYSRGEGENRNVGMNMGEGSNWGTSSNGGSSSSYSSGPNGGSSSSGSSSGWGRSQGGSDNHGRNRGHGASSNTSQGYSEQMAYIMEPATFGRMLKTGGPANRNRVSAVWYQAGRRFVASSGNALLAEFAQ